ncbi:MAG: energy coupling factor transporter S component ThiW [Promethearchaeota archaeon]
MNQEENKHIINKIKEKTITQNQITKRIAVAATFTGVGIVLSHINPFAFVPIIGAKIFPFAHFINVLTGVLIGFLFSSTTALSIAIIRYSLTLGTVHAFHGHLAGAMVVSITAYILWQYKPKYVDMAAFTEPLGTIFIAGTIAEFIQPVQEIVSIEGLLSFWILFGLSSIPGCILGYFMLKVLRRAGISREDFIHQV